MEAQRGEEAPRNWMEALTSGSETRRNICYPVLKVKAFWEASSENRGSEPAVEIPKEPDGKYASGIGKANQKVTRGSSLFFAQRGRKKRPFFIFRGLVGNRYW